MESASGTLKSQISLSECSVGSGLEPVSAPLLEVLPGGFVVLLVCGSESGADMHHTHSVLVAFAFPDVPHSHYPPCLHIPLSY